MISRHAACIPPLVILLVFACPAEAGMILGQHQGSADPATEGFTILSNFGPSSVAAVHNDQGLEAWNLSSLSNSTQLSYAQTFNPTQNQALASQGFTLSVIARITQGPTNAPGSNFYPSLEPTVDFGGGRRFDLALGLNSRGDTVAVLPSALLGGTNFYTPGPSYTLTGSGSSYHLYQLVYSAATQTADLYIDGVDRIAGYTGQTQFTNSGSLSFSANNFGAGNYNLVRLELGNATAVPEPRAIALTAIGGLMAFLGASRRRRPTGRGPRRP